MRVVAASSWCVAKKLASYKESSVQFYKGELDALIANYELETEKVLECVS